MTPRLVSGWPPRFAGWRFLSVNGLSLSQGIDPALLMSDIGLEPDPWQASVLRSTADRLLLLASRQSGKSMTATSAGVHQALYSPDSLVLLAAPTLRQSSELFNDKVIRVYDTLGQPVPQLRRTAATLELSNGSRIVCLPGSEETIRGFSAVSL